MGLSLRSLPPKPSKGVHDHLRPLDGEEVSHEQEDACVGVERKSGSCFSLVSREKEFAVDAVIHRVSDPLPDARFTKALAEVSASGNHTQRSVDGLDDELLPVRIVQILVNIGSLGNECEGSVQLLGDLPDSPTVRMKPGTEDAFERKVVSDSQNRLPEAPEIEVGVDSVSDLWEIGNAEKLGGERSIRVSRCEVGLGSRDKRVKTSGDHSYLVFVAEVFENYGIVQPPDRATLIGKQIGYEENFQ